MVMLRWALISGRSSAASTHPETGKRAAQSPDNRRCRQTTHRRCLAPLQCGFKCILWFRAAIVGTLERITCTLQLYHDFLLYDTHTTPPGGLVCSAEQRIACKQRSHVTCMSAVELYYTVFLGGQRPFLHRRRK